MTLKIIRHYKDSSVMVIARNLMIVDLEVELASLIFYQLLVELFNFPMGRFVLPLNASCLNQYGLLVVSLSKFIYIFVHFWKSSDLSLCTNI